MEYYYKGKSLSQYCKENNLSVFVVKNRFNKLRQLKENKDLTDENILDIVLDTIEEKGCKYTYEGMFLNAYCKKNGLDYNCIKRRIIYLRTLNKNKQESDETLLEIALKKEGRDHYVAKFEYKGKSLYSYCSSHNLDYYAIRLKIKKLQKMESNKDFDLEQIIEKAIIESKKVEEDYYYQGIPLRKFCRNNKLPYSATLLKIDQLKDNPTYSIYTKDEIIDFALSGNKMCNFHYLGRPLNIYCKENNLEFKNILQNVLRLKKDKEKNGYSDNEIIQIAIENAKNNGAIIYRGKPLNKYCLENDLSISIVKKKIMILKQSVAYQNYSFNDIVEKAIILCKKR